MLSLAEIRAAEAVVRSQMPVTPLLFAPALSELTGREVYLKLDTVTPLRTFKLRGALNKLHSLGEAAVVGGVATASAGNHGMAVAYAARIYGRPPTIFVPENANPQKLAVIRGQGATVVKVGEDYQSAFEACQAYVQEHGLTLVHAYNDPFVIAGQGTLGLELLTQMPDLDCVYMGIGGGGLLSGVATACKLTRSSIAVVGVCPAGADSMLRSVAAGRVVELERVDTFADGLAARSPGANTLALTQRYVDQVVSVTDAQIMDAMVTLLQKERLVAEPAGAAALAAFLTKPAAGRKVVVVVSGANIADKVFATLISRAT